MEAYDKIRLSPLERFRFIRDMPTGVLGPSDKLVLFALAARADKYGNSHPKQATIARDTGLSVRTVRDSIAKAADVGLLSRTKRYRQSTVYSLTFEAYAKKVIDLSPKSPQHQSRILN